MNKQRGVTRETETALWSRVMGAAKEDQPARMAACLQRYSSDYPESSLSWLGWTMLADILIDRKQYNKALTAIRRAHNAVPRNRRADVDVRLGHVYCETGKLKTAERWYRRALKDGATTRRFTYLGAALAQQGRLNEAKTCYRQAIRAATDASDEAYLNLGLVLRAQRKYKEALSCFDHALKIDPKYEAAKEARKKIISALKRD